MKSILRKVEDNVEWFYIIYIVILHGMRTLCKDFFSIWWLSALGFACLGIKLVLTKYSKKELLIMSSFFALLLLNFYINHSKTLLLTTITIYGAKNVNMKRVLKYGLWTGVVILAGYFMLVASNVIPMKYTQPLPKYSVILGRVENYRIPQLGFPHPNYAYMSIAMLMTLFILLYGEKIKIWGYLLITTIMYIFYVILLCRTGWYTWIAAMILILGYKISFRFNMQKWYLRGLCLIPLLCAIGCVGELILLEKGNELGKLINQIFTGRFGLIQVECLPQLFSFKCLLGQSPLSIREVAYLTIPYNYGWIAYIIILFLYIKTMFYFASHEQDWECIIFAILGGYFLGEAVPLSAGWNLTLILIAMVIFNEERVVHERD